MNDCIVGLTLGLIVHILPFFIIFLFAFILFTLKTFIIVFSGSLVARILKLMENELLYCGTDKQAQCTYSSPVFFIHFSVFLR